MTRQSTPPPPEPDEWQPDGWRAEFRVVFEQIGTGLRKFLATRLGQPGDVDDAMQSVFITMEEHGRSVAPVSRRAWLFRVAANQSALHWRRKSAGEKAMTKQATGGVREDDVAGALIETETRSRLRNCIEQLPPNYRDVVRLRIDENLTFEQISHRLNVPLSTALTWMRRATQRLRKELEPDGNAEND
jgi:RNA polymerase sigma-70 factor (ECF subfamily)